jgi:hypothetical protein
MRGFRRTEVRFGTRVFSFLFVLRDLLYQSFLGALIHKRDYTEKFPVESKTRTFQQSAENSQPTTKTQRSVYQETRRTGGSIPKLWCYVRARRSDLINTSLQRGGPRRYRCLNRFNGFLSEAVKTAVTILDLTLGTSLKRGANETMMFTQLVQQYNPGDTTQPFRSLRVLVSLW